MADKAQKAIEEGVTPETVEIDRTVLEQLLADIKELKADKEAQTELAKAQMAGSPFASPESIQTDQEAWLEERVQFTIFKDGDKYKDDVTISVNGEIIQVQRGKLVELKRKHYLALQASMAQQITAAEFEESIVDRYEKEIEDKLK